MPFGTKAEITEFIARYLKRPDKESDVADFIALAELDIERKSETVFQGTTVTRTIATAGEIPVPAACLYVTNLSIGTFPVSQLQVITPLDAAVLAERLDGGFPQYAYRQGDTLKLI